MADDDKINWNVDLEVGLFHAIHAHRPIGVNRHFQMVFLHDKFNGALDRKISSKEIWNHLMEMYDLNSLNESDGLPFPNLECEFSITDVVSSDLIDKPFPRSSLGEETRSGAESTKRKETTKETSATATESSSHKDSADNTPLPPRSSKPSAAEANEASRSGSAADMTKLDSRKRTRQSLQSPMPEAPATAAAASSATPTSTPSSGKRSRRI